ncbi:MAG: hypothetical protein GXP23_11365 [Gammaproteobacteria bacterium]|nr:hypothetical protein [Gammaproteobacteria bacterium]
MKVGSWKLEVERKPNDDFDLFCTFSFTAVPLTPYRHAGLDPLTPYRHAGLDPVSSKSLKPLDPGLRRNDGEMLSIFKIRSG